MKLSKAIRQRIMLHYIFEKYLALRFDFYFFKYFERVPFDANILKFAFQDRVQPEEFLNPEDLIRLLEVQFERIPVVETVTWLLFEHFSLNRRRISIVSPKYSQFFFSVILKKHTLSTYIASTHNWLTLSTCKFENVTQIEFLIGKWFQYERAAFMSDFFAPSFEWKQTLLLAFFKAPGTFLSANLIRSQSAKLVVCLSVLMDLPLLEDGMNAVIFEKCHVFMEHYRLVMPAFVSQFHARFNPNFIYRDDLDEQLFTSYKIASLFAIAGRFDSAIKLLKEIRMIRGNSSSDPSLFLRNREFCLYMINQDTELSRWHLGILPDEFYADPA